MFEAGDRVGGVVGTSRLDGFVREHAASSFLGGPPHGALALCTELGVAVEPASPRAKRRWIYLDGALRALPRNPIELARSDLMTWRGKLALLREPLAAPRRPGDDESVHAFAARRFGAEAARAIVAPFVTGVFAADSHDISLEAGFPRLAALDADGGVIRGMVKQLGRGVVARVKGTHEAKTARGLYAPAGGLGALVDALARSLGDRVHLGARIGAIAPEARGVAIGGERWDGAVLAIPADRASELVAATLPGLASRLAPFHRAPAAIVYLGVPEAAVPRARDGFGFLVAQGEDLRVLGVVFESTVWPGRAPEGHALLRCILGGGRDPRVVELSDAELIEVARRAVARAFESEVERGGLAHASVIRWPRGIAQYAVGHRDLVRAADATARMHRLVLAGADYRGAGLNDLCADAAVVADEVRAWS